MADIKHSEITIILNAELERICLESKEIIEGFHKLLGVHSSTEALGKIAVLMREDDTADRLLSKALGHLQTCSELGSKELYQEIAEAFGAASVPPVEGWKPSGVIRLGSDGGLTQRAADICYESASNKHLWQPLKHGDVCIACGKCR